MWQKMPPGFFDVVFVDGSHEAADVLHDATEAYRCVKPGGFIAFDDYGWGTGWDRPKTAIDAFRQCYVGRVEQIESGYCQVFKCLK